MGLCGPLRQLADFVEAVEGSGVAVDSVDFPDGLREPDPTAELELVLPLAAATDDGTDLSIVAGDVESDGSLRLDLETTGSIVPSTPAALAVDVRETSIMPEGTIAVSLSVSVSTDAAAGRGVCETEAETRSANDSPSSSGSGADSSTDADVPPFRNRELLAEVYDSCETFAEMTDALDMDVTAETVRRYMIEHGIHEATSYDTRSDADSDHDETEPVDADADPTDAEPAVANEPPSAGDTDGQEQPVVLTDGIGLAEDLDVDTLIEAVRKSKTIYEVKQEFGVEREDAVDVLRQCNLLDLIAGRLADDGRNEVTREEIVGRLRDASATR